jgi:hypothetical protein
MLHGRELDLIKFSKCLYKCCFVFNGREVGAFKFSTCYIFIYYLCLLHDVLCWKRELDLKTKFLKCLCVTHGVLCYVLHNVLCPEDIITIYC